MTDLGKCEVCGEPLIKHYKFADYCIPCAVALIREFKWDKAPKRMVRAATTGRGRLLK